MKILVLCLPGIGDALMATPMVRVLKKEFPKAEIDIACMFEGVRYVFKNNPYINNVRLLSLYKENRVMGVLRVLLLRKHRYDLSILAFPAFRREYHVVQWLIGAKQRISHKFQRGHWSEFNFLDTTLIPVDEEEHHVTNNLNLLKPLGVDWLVHYKAKDLNYDLYLNKEDKEFGKKYINDLDWSKNKIIGIHPGSINSKLGVQKRWPVNNFAELIKKLIKKGNKILIFIGPDEIEVGLKLYNLIGNEKDCKLLNNLKFNQSVGVLSQIGLLIGNDNGFAHIANALGVKSIILFGPTNMKWCSPYNKNICSIIRKSKSEPWFRNDIKVTDPPADAKSGMEAISVRDVLETLKL